MVNRLLLSLCFSVSCLFCLAQAPEANKPDTTSRVLPAASNRSQDSTKTNFLKKVFQPGYPNPEKAAALSLVLPGAGQIYNKRFSYIKVPIIYAGYTGLIISGEFNRSERNKLQKALVASLKGETHDFSGTRLDSPSALRTTRDQFDKRYQLSYIGVVLLHLVQTLEAYTSAHLLEFDTDESLTISPTVLNRDAAGFGESLPGIKLTYQLGR